MKCSKQQNQLLRILVRQRADEQRVNQRKDGGRRADSESERNDRDESERGILDQNAEGEAKFVQHKIIRRKEQSCWSLVTKRVDRIEMRGGTRREIARRHANHEQDERQNGEAERVVRGNLREIVA